MVKTLVVNAARNFLVMLNDHTNQPSTDALKTVSKRATEKTAEKTSYLIGNKITNNVLTKN